MNDTTPTDLNLVVICGRLAAPAEVRTFDSGVQLIRFLVTTRVDQPRRRVDVIPATLWDPPEDLVANLPARGERVWICGALQRRYWETPTAGRQSRVELVAEQVKCDGVDTLDAQIAEVTR